MEDLYEKPPCNFDRQTRIIMSYVEIFFDGTYTYISVMIKNYLHCLKLDVLLIEWFASRAQIQQKIKFKREILVCYLNSQMWT